MYMIAEVSQYVAVASFAEAWIEIFLRKYWYAGGKSVASFAEAWIEIPSNIAYFRPCLWSPPSRRRGLKSFLECRPRARISVASFAEAWIEIFITRQRRLCLTSPPSRRRGLKSFVFCLRDHFFQCRLLGNRQGFMFQLVRSREAIPE